MLQNSGTRAVEVRPLDLVAQRSPAGRGCARASCYGLAGLMSCFPWQEPESLR
jgi:hypothetical protein